LRQQLPVDSDYFTPPGYIRFVQSIVSQQKYDFIWINELDYAYLTLKSLKYPIHVILDVVDIRSKLRLVQKNIACFVGIKFDYTSKLKREIELMKKFATLIISSQQEMNIVKPSIPSHKLHLIPYTVEITATKQQMIPYQSRLFKYDLLFVGTHYRPNAEGLNFFFNSIFPMILREHPKIKLAIVGKVVELLQLDTALNQNVFCLGLIPDLTEIYLTSKLVICPLLSGSGTKIKLQEAMTYAIPIVTTRTGASGLSLKDGINAFITDEPELYAQRVLNLLKEPKLAQKVSEEVAMTFESEYSISAVYSKLDAMFRI
jgi:glycosyltransferase involved in cell wall biosynthesis